MSNQEVVFANRSARGKLSFSGPERAWFLHQVVTQAFEGIAPGETRDAAMITAHGRTTAYLEALATEDAILAHFEPELRASLPAEIERYVFTTQVEITDVTDDFGLVLVAGAGWHAAAEAAAEAVAGPILTHATRALGAPAAYLWVARSATDTLIVSLQAAGARAASEEELEGTRIDNGVARWGRELDTKTFPQEAGIDGRAVHYDKGCYLGQEAMAKIHFRGKVNRALFRLESDEPVEAGADVLLEGRRVGAVTSSAGRRSLALLRQTVESGSVVNAGRVEAEVVRIDEIADADMTARH